MKQLFTLALALLSYATLHAQTWADDVASIVFDKCAKCHHTGGVAPFSLMTYQEVSSMSAMIETAVTGDVMPPWPPDNNYQQYAHDRSLTATEKSTLLNWITNGTVEGNPANTPPAPVFQTGSILGSGDLELQIPTYASHATISDDYVCFALPTSLPTNRTIKAIEVVPGDPSIVHHCLVYIDANSSGSVTDTVGGDCQGPSSPTAQLLAGYTPGSTPLVLPSVAPLKLGFPIQANSQVVLAMHYPEGSVGMVDSTKVIFHFYPQGETGIRSVFTEMALQNWTFSLPPEQITPVSDTYNVPIEVSILSVFPHMHLIGKSMEVYGIAPNSDTVKLIKIPDWDFEWQDFYKLKHMQHIVPGTVLHADAVFDNTSSNPTNPNSPPITVYAGLNTTDEMMLAFVQYLYYQAGDENYDVDSLLAMSTADILENAYEDQFFTVAPNPFNQSVTIYCDKLTPGDHLSLAIYDQQGRLVKPISINETATTNDYEYIWDGQNENGNIVKAGLYYISIIHNGHPSFQRIIKY